MKRRRRQAPLRRGMEQHGLLMLMLFCASAGLVAAQAPAAAPATATAPARAPIPAAPAAGRTVNVSDDVAFATAVADPTVSRIQLVGNVSLQDTSTTWTPYQPLLRTKDLWIGSLCAPDCTMDGFYTLDFNFLSSLILVDSNVTVELDYMVIANLRKVAGVGIDIFLGRPGSTILTNNDIASRLACSPTRFQSAVIQNSTLQNTSTQTSTAAPPAAPTASRNTTVLSEFCWRGNCYPDTLRYIQYAAQVPSSNSEGGLSIYGADSGYHFGIINGTRLCASYWPADCLNSMTADACNIYYIDQALQQLQDPSSSDRSPAVIAVPVALCAAIIAGVLFLVVLLVRRRRHDRRLAKTVKAESSSDLESGIHSSGGSSHKGPVLSFVDGPPMHKHQQSGWQLLARHTSPDVEGVGLADDKIALGVLLGAGSSGRVYRARWRDQDVAVKVLQHDAQTAALVANETDLMMGFDDRNIVRAFHVVSWRQTSGQHSSERQDAPPSKANTTSTVALLPNSPSEAKLVPVTNGMPKDKLGPSVGNRSTSSISHSGALHYTGGSNITASQNARRHQNLESDPTSTVTSGAIGIVEASDALDEGFLDDPDSEGFNALAQTWLIQEYCDGGTLADAVRSGRYRRTDGQPDMAKVLTRLHDVASGMRYLHARNVLHRDLKAANVMLVLDPNAPYGAIAKVTDFGLSTAMRPGQTHHSTRTMGTISHMAPELLRAGKQSPAADVYAFGIVMWEIVSGRSAFGNAHYGEVFERVAILGERPELDADVQQACGEEYMLLMAACWNADPALRPTFEQVCEGLELLQQHHMGLANGDVAAAAAAGTGAALTANLSRHWNIVAQAPQQPDPEPVHGFF